MYFYEKKSKRIEYPIFFYKSWGENKCTPLTNKRKHNNKYIWHRT